MQTRVVAIDSAAPDEAALNAAAEVLRRGGLVAFPTETVYGLGAHALDAEAVARIFQAKSRPANDPIIVHIHALTQLDFIAESTPLAKALAAEFWPGPLTLVLKRRDPVPALVSAGMPTVAVRMPSGSVVRSLLAVSEMMIAAPSANAFSRPSATTAAHVLEDLDGRIDMLLDGGPTAVGLESTVLDVTRAVPTVLRHGAVTVERLRALLPQVAVLERMTALDEAAPAPGMLLKHYSPRAELLVYAGAQDEVQRAMLATIQRLQAEGRQVGVLVRDEEASTFALPRVWLERLGPEADLEMTGARLFAALRSLDASGVDTILVRTAAPVGLGAAIHDRLLRAAEGRIIHVEG